MSYTGPVHVPHEKSGHDFFVCSITDRNFLATLFLGKLLGSRFWDKPPDNYPQTNSKTVNDPCLIFPIVILKFKVTADMNTCNYP